MKRPATDLPEIEPLRTRRRYTSQQPAAILNLGGQPHPGRASDDERAQSLGRILSKGDKSLSNRSLNHNSDGLCHL